MTWDTNAMKSVSSMTTLGGHVYAVQQSPFDPGRLAVGCGDNLLRLWNTEAANATDCVVFWKSIQSRVRSLAWHPVSEELLAFGTEDGTVGMYDVARSKPTPTSVQCKSAVVSLCWTRDGE